MIYFELPVPPSINVAYRNARGRRVKTRAAIDWGMEANWAIRRQMIGRQMVKDPCALIVNFERGASAPREDVDNRLKLLQDALKTGGAILDDSLIVAVAAAWAPADRRIARLALVPLADGATPLRLEYVPRPLATGRAVSGIWIINEGEEDDGI